MEYEVEYTISEFGGSITLNKVWPESDYVEGLFYNGSLFHTINLDEYGDYRLNVHVAEDGYLSINGLEEYVGWRNIDKY